MIFDNYQYYQDQIIHRQEISITSFRFRSRKNEEPWFKNPNPSENEILAEKIIQLKKDSKTNAYIRFSQDYVKKTWPNGRTQIPQFVKEAAEKWINLDENKKIVTNFHEIFKTLKKVLKS